MSNTYLEMLHTSATEAGSLLCVGVDPPNQNAPLAILLEVLTEAARRGVQVAAFKPNIGYFHALDRPRDHEFTGSILLADTLDYLQRYFPRIPVILDSKRGDIARSSENYATEAFTSWAVDAMTGSPWMGDDSVLPLAQPDKGLYLVARSSNPGARRFQRPEEVVPVILEWRHHNQGIGMVLGATAPAELKAVLRTLTQAGSAGEMPILIPGVGRQGGSAAAVMAILRESGFPLPLVRINLSSGILTPWGASDPGNDDARREQMLTALLQAHRDLAL
jgi:orotidine-5'-phosphate decarboxylase